MLILQHPLEVANAKGSARLLHFCLPHSRLVVGETFAEAELRALLHAPWEPTAASDPRKEVRPLLLYPELPGTLAQSAGAMHAGDVATEEPSASQARPRLVVLDATWRKSCKMLHQNSLLHALPRLALADLPPTRYLVRKAHLPHQLSTLEATCQALMRLEKDPQKFQPLLQAFDGFIGQQLSFRPA